MPLKIIFLLLFAFAGCGSSEEERKNSGPSPKTTANSSSEEHAEDAKSSSQGDLPPRGEPIFPSNVDERGNRTNVGFVPYDPCAKKACPKKDDTETEEDIRNSSLKPLRGAP